MHSFHDPEDFFDADDLRQAREEKQRLEDLAAQRNAEERKRREELEARMAIEGAERTKRHILREYEARGLTPPPGTLVSLSMLKILGWKVEEDQFGPRLVPPASMPAQPRRTREEYANDEGAAS